MRLRAKTSLGARECNKRTRIAIVFLVTIVGLSPEVLFAGEDGRLIENARAADRGVNSQKGKVLFERNCALCHGIDGTGGRGPSLTRPRLSRAPDDAALRAVIQNGIAPEMPNDGRFLLDEDLTALISYVRSLGKTVNPVPPPGDVAHGKYVLVRSGCLACHIVAGEGAGFGPELTGLSERRSAAYVRETIMKPAEHLPADFLMVRAISLSGASIQGIRVNEDTFTIQIKDIAEKFYSFRKADLTELQQLKGETPMPSFERVLTKRELEDLVAYLVSPRSAP